MSIDYRELLIRYMAQVVDCEGVNFVHNADGEGTFLSREDKALLGEIELESNRLRASKS